MKKKTILFLGVVCGLSLHAQENVKILDRSAEGTIHKSSQTVITNKSKTAAQVIWSEDFSGGIPTGWSNTGSSANALWEYRGPSTTPNNTVGSRGAYAGTATITSATAGNGYVIFDSDYLDNNGVAGNFGNGAAPTPHISVLKTGVIDLSGYPNVQLTLTSYMRYFAGRTIVAFSSDGGVTFPDSVRLHSAVAVNAATTTNEASVVNISNYVGNSANTVIAFVYDGASTEPAANGLGYYYWMMDDIAIEVLPNNAFSFTPYQGAPPMDIIYGNAADGNAKSGILMKENVMPLSFDANAINFGVNAQTNVKLTVEVYRDGNLATTLNSTPIAVLNPGDTATFNDLFTPQYTPSQTGTYEAIYTISSDSVPAQTGSVQPMDTAYTFFVTDTVTSLDFNTIDNTIGTTQLGDDGSALASALYFNNPAPGTNTKLDVRSLDVYFATATVAGGDIQVEIYDTAGFDFTGGFGSSPIASVPYTVDATFPGTLKRLPLQNQNILLDTDKGYYFVVYMFSNGGTNLIRLGNDQTVDQAGAISIMYNADDARWYSGYSGGSRSFESPFIRVNTRYKTIGLDENDAVNFSVFPNPTNGSDVRVNIAEGGTYTVELVNMLGQTISTSEVSVNGNENVSMDYSSVANGVYLLNVSSERGTRSVRLTIK